MDYWLFFANFWPVFAVSGVVLLLVLAAGFALIKHPGWLLSILLYGGAGLIVNLLITYYMAWAGGIEPGEVTIYAKIPLLIIIVFAFFWVSSRAKRGQIETGAGGGQVSGAGK